MSQYDRTVFRAVARDKGDRTPSDTARTLKVAVATAWRLWNGIGAPSSQLAAKAEAAYGITAADLLRTTERAA